jgi:DNA-binding NtrC family response regulator
LIRLFLSIQRNKYSLTDETQEAMLAYDWPGNVRELSNCVQQMIAMNSGPLLHTAGLPSPLRNQLGSARVEVRTMGATARGPTGGRPEFLFGAPEPEPVILTLSEIEKRAIIEALDYTKGDHTTAAQLLGIGRTTLYPKLKEYRLEDLAIPPLKPVGSAADAIPYPLASNL